MLAFDPQFGPSCDTLQERKTRLSLSYVPVSLTQADVAITETLAASPAIQRSKDIPI